MERSVYLKLPLCRCIEQKLIRYHNEHLTDRHTPIGIGSKLAPFMYCQICKRAIINNTVIFVTNVIGRKNK